MPKNIHEKFREFLDYLNSLNLSDNELYEQYAMMKNAVKVLDERIDELNGMIVEEMDRLQVDQQKFPYGTFAFTERKSWKYSKDLEDKLWEVKMDKQREEKEGVAKFEVKKSLLFKGI